MFFLFFFPSNKSWWLVPDDGERLSSLCSQIGCLFPGNENFIDTLCCLFLQPFISTAYANHLKVSPLFRVCWKNGRSCSHCHTCFNSFNFLFNPEFPQPVVFPVKCLISVKKRSLMVVVSYESPFTSKFSERLLGLLKETNW